jgi:hypothetical protein
VITIYYVNLTDPTTSAEIAVSAGSPITQAFTGFAVCCAGIALSPMTISAGTHTITIGNDNGPGPGHRQNRDQSTVTSAESDQPMPAGVGLAVLPVVRV